MSATWPFKSQDIRRGKLVQVKPTSPSLSETETQMKVVLPKPVDGMKNPHRDSYLFMRPVTLNNILAILKGKRNGNCK